MSIVPVVPTQDALVADFRGPWFRPQPNDVPSSEALLSINAEYNPHNCGTRFAFFPFWNSGKIITTLFNWIKAADLVIPNGNALVLFDQSSLEVQLVPNLLSPAFYVGGLFSCPSGTEGISISEYGNQLIIASFEPQTGAGGPAAIGSQAAQVVSIAGAAVYVDPAFMGGITTKPTLANSGTGTVTAGLHSVGFILTSRSGFTGPVNPVQGGDIVGNPALVGSYNLFNTTSNITAPGGEQISVSITATWPIGCNGLQFVMSTAANPYEYYLIPDQGNSFAALSGTTTTITYTIDVSDAILLATGTDVTNNQFLLTQDTASPPNPPFKPFKVVEYGNRIGYLTFDLQNTPALYMSDPNNAQHITEAFNKLRLPGWRQMMSGAVLQTNLYVQGPDWTYAFQDNGLQPVDWPAPILIDGTVGSNCPLGVQIASSADWFVTATDTGLYSFNGQYSDRPLSYMTDSDWRRINFNAALTIRIAINRDKKQILVVVPLDGATIPNYLMVFDYTDGSEQVGPDWQSTKYSLWPISGYSPRGIVVWQNPSTGRMETLLGSGTQTVLTGTVSTSGTNVTWVSGSTFLPGPAWVGSVITIGGNPFTIATVPSPTSMTVTTSAGTHASLAFSLPVGALLRQQNQTDDGAVYNTSSFQCYVENNGLANVPVPWTWECAPQPEGSVGTLFMHVGGYLRAAGSGLLTAITYSLDHFLSAPWTKPVSMPSDTQGKEVFRQFKLNAERASVSFSCGQNVGDYVILSAWRHRFYQWGSRR